MLIVPLRGDKIQVSGWADEQVVNSYSSLKEGGAVYVRNPLDPAVPYTPLSSIQTINRVPVELKSNGLFSPKGLVKRPLNLPQIGDKVQILINKDPQGVEEKAYYVVTDLRITNAPKSPLLVICDKSKFTLTDIIGIERKQGFESFKVIAFRSLYLDYLPIGSKPKS